MLRLCLYEHKTCGVDTDMHLVASIVLYGDPSFVKGQAWDQGTANGTSYFPREDNAACGPIADQGESSHIPPLWIWISG